MSQQDTLSNAAYHVRKATGDGVPATFAQDRSIRLLVFATLYPNVAQPRHGVFTEERMRQLAASG